LLSGLPEIPNYRILFENGKIIMNSTHLKSTSDSKTSSLNFKVSDDFKKAFKGYAVSQGVSMAELLKMGFELTKKHRG